MQLAKMSIDPVNFVELTADVFGVIFIELWLWGLSRGDHAPQTHRSASALPIVDNSSLERRP